MAGKPTRVWHVNLWSLPKKRGEATYTDYDSVDALVADGWIVD